MFLLVRRETAGIERPHPSPNGPLPDPELYERDSAGWKPERPGETKTGIENVAAPVAGATENFSPIDRPAPPPLGSEIDGIKDSREFSVSGLEFDLFS